MASLISKMGRIRAVALVATVLVGVLWLLSMAGFRWAIGGAPGGVGVSEGCFWVEGDAGDWDDTDKWDAFVHWLPLKHKFLPELWIARRDPSLFRPDGLPVHLNVVTSDWVLDVPLWIPLLLCAAMVRWGPRPRIPGQCGKCGYCLTGNTSGVCPECGKAVNRA